MKKMFELFRQIWISNKSIIKVLLVFAAFVLMVASSCIYMNHTLNKKLLEHTEEVINDMQSFISYALTGPSMVINFFADTIQEMILRGESAESIQAYMTEFSSPAFKERINAFDYYSVYGYFEVFGVFLDGADWIQPDDYAPQERPWYLTAVDAGDNVVISPVYVSINQNTPVIGYARRLSDNENRLLGVISINVPVDFISQLAEGNHITKNSYGFIVNEQLVVITHPSKQLIGEVMGTSHADIAAIADLIRQGREVSLYKVKGYRGVNSFIFSREIINGWYINFMVPEAEYYKELYEMMAIFSVLGLIMACMLSIVLVRIDIARNRSDMQNKKKSSFLAVMSHEIRTPMNAIMGIAEAQLEEHDETLPPNIQEAFDKIYYSGGLLLQIISDLLDLSKIEAGKLEIITGRYEVASLINEVVHINKIKFDNKPIEFKLYVDENIPASLTGDELRIKQILNNLLSNAFKYTWKGEVSLSVTASIPAVTSGGGDELDVMLILSVSDTGQGISSHDMKRLFDEYTRFNLNANRSTVGAGLGLSITQDLVDLMHGEIKVESEVEKGSTFTVLLPQKTDILPEQGSFVVLGKKVVDNLCRLQFSSVTRSKRPPILRENMSYGKVLIVDDVEMNLFVARLLMRPYGLKIDTASSGYEAIDRIKEGDVYDVIFMDHMMPKMDGIEAVRIIRGMGYKPSIIALTANAVAGQADIFLSSGFNDFISKPIDIIMLNKILNKYIRDKKVKQTEVKLQKQEKKAEGGEPGVSDAINIPGLNVEQGLEVFDGDKEDYISALHSFAKNAPESLDKLRGVTKENLSDYAINVHGIKSISAWICAESIRKGAAELEALAKAGDAAGVLALNEQFLKDTEIFLTELKAQLGK
jgi:signal transduction histidine kinase/DNA-binding NarL/FixJ family response regulator/HPt (histidine-containing phosphotransfer) domain-containing protein